MKHKYKVLLFVAPVIIILDQLTKWIISISVPDGGSVSVIGGFFDIVHTYNTGAAFGIFANMSDGFRVPFFYTAALVAAVVFAVYFYRLSESEKLMSWTLSLIFGGMIGNLIDRFRMGRVLDFVSIHIGDKSYLAWPAFNVADSAITIAMFLLIAGIFRGEEEK